MYAEDSIKELRLVHSRIEGDITKRLKEFAQIGMRGSDRQLFTELAFCLLTPQSKAVSCWKAIECLLDTDLLMKGQDLEIAKEIKDKTRFHNQKAKNVVLARELFTDEETGELNIRRRFLSFDNVFTLRDWLVDNVRGLGYKEASHFLRNIGKGKNLAILDRHILGNLVNLGVISEIPTSLSSKRYMQIESEMLRFSGYIGIRMDHLDLVLWYMQTGEVFK
jgi:N-glycosylase/DNA lyase